VDKIYVPSLIKTGDVDFILSLNTIAPKLIELIGAERG